MKSYSIVFILTALVIIPSIVKSSPFGLLSAFSGSTQNAQNSLTQGERNRSLDFIRTVLVTPLYGPGISYKFGLLSRLFRQFSQISENRPANGQQGIGNILPSSISKTLHFNRGITVTSSNQNDAAITHATVSTTETDIDVDDKDVKEKDIDMDMDSDMEKNTAGDSEKDEESNANKDAEDDTDKNTGNNSDKDDEKDSDKDDGKDSDKDDEKDSDKDDGKDSDKDDEKYSDKDGEKSSDKEFVNFDFNSKESSNGDSKDDSSLALFTNALTSVTNNNNNVTESDSIQSSRSNLGDAKKNTNNKNSITSTNTRTDIGDTKKDTNKSNNNAAEAIIKSNSITASATSINNNLRADSGKNVTGTGGYHYAPHGYRYTRNGPTISFQPSEIINTLGG